MGTISNVRQILRLPGDNVRVMVEGVSRGRLLPADQTEPYLLAEVEEHPGRAAGAALRPDGGPDPPDLRAL